MGSFGFIVGQWRKKSHCKPLEEPISISIAFKRQLRMKSREEKKVHMRKRSVERFDMR